MKGALTDLGKLSVEASPLMATPKDRVARKLKPEAVGRALAA